MSLSANASPVEALRYAIHCALSEYSEFIERAKSDTELTEDVRARSIEHFSAMRTHLSNLEKELDAAPAPQGALESTFLLKMAYRILKSISE